MAASALNLKATTAPNNNVLPFQSKQEYCPYEHYQTSSERQVYSKMYQQTNLGRESKRFTLDGLQYATAYKSQDTVRVALAGLVRKGHVTILDKKRCRHYGILYRVQMPHEIRALNQDPAYLAEQARLAEEVKKPKAKQQKLPFDDPDHQQSAGENPPAAAPEMPVTSAALVAAVEPLAEASEPSEKPAIRAQNLPHWMNL